MRSQQVLSSCLLPLLLLALISLPSTSAFVPALPQRHVYKQPAAPSSRSQPLAQQVRVPQGQGGQWVGMGGPGGLAERAGL